MSTLHAVIQAETSSRPAYGASANSQPVDVRVGEHVVTVSFVIVNRECYDGMSTPTVRFAIDGKRAKRADVYAMCRAIDARAA